MRGSLPPCYTQYKPPNRTNRARCRKAIPIRYLHTITLILSPLLFIAAGFVWGLIWISAIHAIFYFFLISPVVDILVYRYVGIRLRRTLNASSLNHAVQFGLGALNIAMFFIGNRVILFGWVLGVWPWKDSEIDWILVSMDVLSLGIGLAIATGFYQPNHDHRTHPNET